METAPGVQRLTQGVTNFYLIEEGGKLVLVDAGTPGDWALFTATVAQMAHRLDDLDAVLLTHAHSDHTGFAEKARTTAGAPVWIHHDDEQALKTGQTAKPDGGMGAYLFKLQMYKTMLSLGRRGASKIVPVAEASTFDDGEKVDVPGKPRVIHAPGHTAGSCALLLEERNVLFAGDVLATWNAFTGHGGPQIMPSAMNQDTSRALQSLGALEGISAELVLPGHGDPWTGGVEEAVKLARQAGPS